MSSEFCPPRVARANLARFATAKRKRFQHCQSSGTRVDHLLSPLIRPQPVQIGCKPCCHKPGGGRPFFCIVHVLPFDDTDSPLVVALCHPTLSSGARAERASACKRQLGHKSRNIPYSSSMLEQHAYLLDYFVEFPSCPFASESFKNASTELCRWRTR